MLLLMKSRPKADHVCVCCQFLRDWLTRSGLKGKEGVEMPPEIVQQTQHKYVEAYERLTGDKWAATE